LVVNKKGWGFVALTLLWLAAAYFWVAPIFKPRGLFGGGHYRLVDIYLGVPLLMIALCATIFIAGPASRRRKLTFQLAAISASVLITVAIADFGYAFVVEGAGTPSHTDEWFDGISITRKDNLPDEELGFVRKPGASWQGRLSPESRYVTYSTDENGFRNPPGLSKADVVFIGDSFTEGASVPEEDTFVRKFSLGSKLSAINLGRGNYGPQQELIILKRYGFRYGPSLVVWQIFEGNDLTDARHFADWKANPGRHDSISLRYTKRSLIARWLGRTIPKDQGAARLFEDRNGQTGRLFLDYSYIPDQPAREPLGMSETRKAIEEGYRLCQSRGIKLSIIFVPIKVRVLGPYVRFTDTRDRDYYLPGGKLDSDSDFGSELAKFSEGLGCPFLDMTRALRRRAAEDNRFVYATNQDSHLDVDGHSVVAQVLAEWMQANASKGFARP
jgi:hypothetical protein